MEPAPAIDSGEVGGPQGGAAAGQGFEYAKGQREHQSTLEGVLKIEAQIVPVRLPTALRPSPFPPCGTCRGREILTIEHVKEVHQDLIKDWDKKKFCEICEIPVDCFLSHKFNFHLSAPLQCVQCNPRFRGKKEFLVHFNAFHHPGNHLLCPRCPIRCKSESTFHRHIAQIHGELNSTDYHHNPYMCLVCSSRIEDEKTFRDHKEICTSRGKLAPDRSFWCEISPKGMFWVPFWNPRQSDLPGGSRYLENANCEFCNRECKYRSFLEQHQKYCMEKEMLAGTEENLT